MIVVILLAQAGGIELSVGQIALGIGLAILLNMGTITVPGGFPVVAMFLATSLDLPFEAVGLLIAVDWLFGIFRTFLNVNGDTFVAILVANADGKTRSRGLQRHHRHQGGHGRGDRPRRVPGCDGAGRPG